LKDLNPCSPLVSVVIPVYNRSHLVGRAISSVLQQTYPSFEIVVVNDGSTDCTPKTVADLASSDSRVRYFSHPWNKGAQAARNTGILHSRGEWLAFQDSDDEWMPGKLEKQIHILGTRGYDPFVSIYTNGLQLNHQSQEVHSLDLPDIAGKEGYARILSRSGPLFQGLLVSKLAMERIGYLDENVPAHQEWDTAIRLARHCRFVYLHEPLFTYHVESGHSLSKNSKRDIQGYAYIINKFRDQIIDILGKTGWEKHHYTLVSRCLNFGLWSEANHFLSAIQSKRTIRYFLYRIFCYWRIKPSWISGPLKRFKNPRKVALSRDFATFH